MLTTVEGVYRDGHVELRETPENIREARVLVTFLGSSPGSNEAQTTTEERIRAFRAMVAGLPAAPTVPLDAMDRENLYP